MRRRLPAALLSAYVFCACVFLLAPVLVIVPISFTSGETYRFPPPGFSFRWYEKLWTDGLFAEAFWLSARVALLATVLSMVLGTAAAFAVLRVSRRTRFLASYLMTVPLLFPHLIYGMAMLMFLTYLGLPGTFIGFVLAHTIITLPYMFRIIGASVGAVQRETLEAASSLGASPARVFRYVTIPAIRPGLFAGAAFSFIVSFDDFSTSLFLVSANNVTLPVDIYHYVEQVVDPSIASVSTLLIVLSCVVVVAIECSYGLKRLFGAGQLD